MKKYTKPSISESFDCCNCKDNFNQVFPAALLVPAATAAAGLVGLAVGRKIKQMVEINEQEANIRSLRRVLS